MAEPGSEIAKGILDGLIARSKPFGTEVTVHDGVGVVRVK